MTRRILKSSPALTAFLIRNFCRLNLSINREFGLSQALEENSFLPWWHGQSIRKYLRNHRVKVRIILGTDNRRNALCLFK